MQVCCCYCPEAPYCQILMVPRVRVWVNPNPDPDPGPKPNPDPEPDPNLDLDPNPDSNLNPNPYTNPNLHPEPNPGLAIPILHYGVVFDPTRRGRINKCTTLLLMLSVRWGAFQCISAAVPVLPSSVSNGSVWGGHWISCSNRIAPLLCCTHCSSYVRDETDTGTSQHTGSIT